MVHFGVRDIAACHVDCGVTSIHRDMGTLTVQSEVP